METVVAIRLLLGLVFLLSALPKLRSFGRTSGVIRSYSLLPERAVAPAAFVLPFAELALAVALLSGWQSRVVSVAAAGTLALFSLAIGINVARRNAIDCGCGGLGGPSQVGWALVVRNLMLACAACVVALDPPPSIAVLVDQRRIGVADLVALAASDVLALLAFAVTIRILTLERAARSVERALLDRSGRPA